MDLTVYFTPPIRLRRGEHTGEQGNERQTNERNTAAGDELLDALRLCARVVVAVTLHEVDKSPNAKTAAQRDNESLQSRDCGSKECHIFTFFGTLCRLSLNSLDVENGRGVKIYGGPRESGGQNTYGLRSFTSLFIKISADNYSADADIS